MRHRSKLGLWALLAACLLAAATPPAWSTTVQPLTIVQLLMRAKVIVWGKVSDVQNVPGSPLPYTRVTVEVRESFRGGPMATFSFNQFGNEAPAADGNGLLRLTGTPGGFPTYRVGDEVVLFMGQAASATGLQSPIGLGLGTFKIAATKARNDFENVGLFTNVQLDSSLMNPEIETMMATTEGPYDAEAFIDFVRQATSEDWAGSGILTTGGGGGGGGRRNVITQE